MKSLLSILILLIFVPQIIAQEQLSQQINYSPVFSETPHAIIEQDGFIYISESNFFCDTTKLDTRCMMVSKIDSCYQVDWTTTFTEDTLNLLNGINDIVYLNDKVFVLYKNFYYLPNDRYYHLYALNTEGAIVDSYLIDNSLDVDYSRIGAIQVVDNFLYYILITNDKKIKILKFDDSLNLLAEKESIIPANNIDKIDVHILQNEDVLVSFPDRISGSRFDLTHILFDNNLNLISQFSEETAEDIYQYGFDVVPLANGGNLTYFDRDYPDYPDVPFVIDTFTILYSSDNAPIVYKYDSYYNVEWEFQFLHHSYKQGYTFEAINDTLFLGCGESSFIDYTRNGWAFLMDINGNIVWEHLILDRRLYSGGFFIDGVKTYDGYALFGGGSIESEPNSQWSDDPVAWLVNLDENGCFNGECNDYIVIENDSTYYSFNLDFTTEIIPEIPYQASKIYPNPSNGIINIEHQNNEYKHIQIINMQGQSIFENSTDTKKSIINIRGIEEGMYVISIQDEKGKVISKEKMIVSY